jgi:DNA-binding NarL/FixJ family response regulator
MSKTLTALIFDAATGGVTERPLTAKEISEHEEMQAEAEAQQAEREAKIAARTSALAKLAALGLTEEEIAAL